MQHACSHVIVVFSPCFGGKSQTRAPPTWGPSASPAITSNQIMEVKGEDGGQVRRHTQRYFSHVATNWSGCFSLACARPWQCACSTLTTQVLGTGGAPHVVSMLPWRVRGRLPALTTFTTLVGVWYWETPSRHYALVGAGPAYVHVHATARHVNTPVCNSHMWYVCFMRVHITGT